MRRIRKALAVFLAGCILCSSVQLEVSAEENAAGVQGETIPAVFGNETGSQDGWDGSATDNVYEGGNYKVTFSLTRQWDGGYQADIVINNTGDATIDNWSLQMMCPDTITNIWNASIQESTDGVFIFKNAGWNQDIPVGGSVSFGYIASDSFSGFPEEYVLVEKGVVCSEKDYQIVYTLESDWVTGYTAVISITNNTDTTIEDWILEFDFDRTITQIWNGVIDEVNGNHYVVKNAEYNADIQPGQMISFGFMGEAGDAAMEPVNYILSQMKEGAGENLTVTMNQLDNMYVYDGINGYLIVDKIEEFNGTVSLPDSQIKKMEISVQAGNVDIPQNSAVLENGVWKASEPQLFIGDNVFTVTVYSESGSEAEYSTHIWNTSEENMNLLDVDMNDNDQDGLQNYREEQYGTNPDSADTDGDGFSDTEEIFLLDTDPLVYNDDGDYDQDGLSNKEELKINTDIYSSDTDCDGLTDYDEVKTYGTDPKVQDTDRDGIVDPVEIRLGTDPCAAEQLEEDGTVRLEYPLAAAGGRVEAMLDISMLPEQMESFGVEEIKVDDAVLSDEIPGYLGEGSAYDFTLDGTFAGAVLTYRIDEELSRQEGFEPGIYYYNEGTQMLEELENAVWDGDTISVELEHFSRYILLNKTEYGRVWDYTLHFDNSKLNNSSLDIVFVIDSSGSMRENDRGGVRRTVTKNFINKLTDNDRAAIVDFDFYASVYSGFTNDKEILYGAVDRIDSLGGTSLNVGISAALGLFGAKDYEGRDKQKCIVMLTDGGGPYNTYYTADAKNSGITIYTVGLGKGVSTGVLTKMAEETGGAYFHTSEADKLYSIFDDLVELTDLYKDSDSDGVSDYHEKAMASGVLRLGTGVSLIGMDYLDNDSDDDGIIDGNEIQVSQVGATVYVRMSSHPTKKDSDGDGLEDGVERNEISTNIGNHKLDPLSRDTDKDGIPDNEELGTYVEDLGYYRVNSNPFMKEDYILGDQKAVSYIFTNKVYNPGLLKKKYSEGNMPNGKPYTIYTFIDTSAVPFSKRKLVEVGDWYEREYYLLFASTGNCARGGQGDEIYRKADYDYLTEEFVTNGSMALIGINALFAGEKESFLGIDGNSDDFLYFDNSRDEFLSTDGWQMIHFEERFDMNCCYDKYLPITSYEAAKMGFEKLPMKDSKYHIPEGIESETEKGATHKYITNDGLEAIYELLYDADSVESVTNDYRGTKMLPLQDYPTIGPTFNYAPNDDNKMSDASIAHYYFDMLPFFWWGGVRE